MNSEDNSVYSFEFPHLNCRIDVFSADDADLLKERQSLCLWTECLGPAGDLDIDEVEHFVSRSTRPMLYLSTDILSAQYVALDHAEQLLQLGNRHAPTVNPNFPAKSYFRFRKEPWTELVLPICHSIFPRKDVSVTLNIFQWDGPLCQLGV